MWKYYYEAICYRLFMPYIVYMLAFTAYASWLAYVPWTGIFALGKLVCLVIFFPSYVWFFGLELKQVRGDAAAYFSNFWNVMDFISLIACGTFMVFSLITPESRDLLYTISALAVLILWMKLFYWLRLFKPFSAFIRMISEIVYDIRIFAVMLAIVFIAFGNCIVILNRNRDPVVDPLFQSYLGINGVDSLINAYLLGLGDFDYSNYGSGKNKYFIWIFFLAATFIVQLVFMNMLIAIMGDSFGRINGLLDQATLKELCVMMQDNDFLIDIKKDFETSRYILWLTPGVTKSAGSVIERQVSQLRDYVEDRQEQSDNMMLRQMGVLDEQLKEIKATLNAQANPEKQEEEDGDADDYDDSEDSGHEEVGERIGNLETKLDELTEMVRKLINNADDKQAAKADKKAKKQEKKGKKNKGDNDDAGSAKASQEEDE